jgi:signal transduction histidine kinase/ActR/RegA family two-component response regulator
MITVSTLRRNVILAGIALISMIIAAHGYEAWRNYRNALAHSEDTARSLSHALADDTARTILEVGSALAEFSIWADSPSAAAAPPLATQELLSNRLSRLPVIQSAAIIGADGHLRASIGGTEWVDDWSGSDVFLRAPHAARGSLYFGLPEIREHSHTDGMTLSRGLFDHSGAFSGIIIARVGVEYVSRLYAAVNMAPDAVIRLLRDDGVVLSRFPNAVVDAHDSGADHDSSWPNAVLEAFFGSGYRRMIVHSPVPHYPLTIEVAEPMTRVLANWRHEESSSAARTSAIVLLASILIAALAAALRRHERSDKKRLRLEKQLRQTLQAESLGMFAASIAHDFNNVLGAIVGYGDLALDALLGDSPARVHIERLLTASERARQLVRRFLTFDLRRGTRNAHLDIEPIAREVLDQIRATLPAGITLRKHDSQTLKAIRGDATEVHQVVMNVCSNAVRAMPEGGNLDVAIENVVIHERQSTSIGELTPGQWVRLSVTDHGVGMSPTLLAMIFEPFSTTKDVEHGAGIGLAVVKNIVASMGGAITVESEEGVGSKFSLYWPAVARGESADANNVATAAAGCGQIIMIVDDDSTLVGIAEELLAALGYEPVGFTDPARALEVLRQNPSGYDALISDQQMSTTMRGTDLARAVRAFCGDLPIVLITAHRDAHLKDRAEAAGVREILDKPLRSEQLREVLARVLAARSPAGINSPPIHERASDP